MTRVFCDACSAPADQPVLRLTLSEDKERRTYDLCSRCLAAVEDVLGPREVRILDGRPVEGERVRRSKQPREET